MNASYEVKLSDIPLASEDSNELDCIDIITQFRMMMGANKDHTPAQLQLEARYIKNSFGHLSVDDFHIGIQLFLDNKLDIDLPTYVTFSPLFISHVFNAYVRYRKKVIKEVEIFSEQKLLVLDENTEQRRIEGLRECVKDCYKHSREDFKERFFNSMVYDVLRKSKRLVLNETIIKEGKVYAEKKFLADRKANHEREKLKLDAKPPGDELKNANPAKLYDRKKAEQEYAKDYFLMKYFQSANLDELINSINVKDLFEVQ